MRRRRRLPSPRGAATQDASDSLQQASSNRPRLPKRIKMWPRRLPRFRRPRNSSVTCWRTRRPNPRIRPLRDPRGSSLRKANSWRGRWTNSIGPSMAKFREASSRAERPASRVRASRHRISKRPIARDSPANLRTARPSGQPQQGRGTNGRGDRPPAKPLHVGEFIEPTSAAGGAAAAAAAKSQSRRESQLAESKPGLRQLSRNRTRCWRDAGWRLRRYARSRADWRGLGRASRAANGRRDGIPIDAGRAPVPSRD